MSFAITMDTDLSVLLRNMIGNAFGRCAAKKASGWADASPRTIEDWMQGRVEPGAFKLLRMVRHPEFRAELRAYCDRIEQEEATIAARLDRLDATRAGVMARVERAESRRAQSVVAPARRGVSAKVGAVSVDG